MIRSLLVPWTARGARHTNCRRIPNTAHEHSSDDLKRPESSSGTFSYSARVGLSFIALCFNFCYCELWHWASKVLSAAKAFSACAAQLPRDVSCEAGTCAAALSGCLGEGARTSTRRQQHAVQRHPLGSMNLRIHPIVFPLSINRSLLKSGCRFRNNGSSAFATA